MEETSRVFAGTKVLDLSASITSLLVTKWLADHGATVVWIESREHLDITRTSAPYRDGRVHPDHSGHAATALTSRHSFGLNMNQQGAKDVLARLTKWADIVVQSLRPGIMEEWGIAYEQISQWKPDVIMLSVSIHGQTGKRAQMPGWGQQTQGFQGFPTFTGWPDRPGVSVPLPYTDVCTPWLAASALLAAMDYKRRIGKGQHLDFSQIEAALHFIPGYHLLDYFASGDRWERKGNRSDGACPHGVYPCHGDDRWVAIAAFDDREWKALCSAMGDPAWVKEQRFATLLNRKAHQDELDDLLAQWTRDFSAEKLMLLLQERGVCCGVVENCADLMDGDPQLRHREYWQILSRPGLGECKHAAWPAKLTGTPAELRPTPLFGEHTEYVCQEFLNMRQEEIDSLIASGVLEITI